MRTSVDGHPWQILMIRAINDLNEPKLFISYEAVDTGPHSLKPHFLISFHLQNVKMNPYDLDLLFSCKRYTCTCFCVFLVLLKWNINDFFFPSRTYNYIAMFYRGFLTSFTGRSHWNQEFCFIRKTTTGIKVTHHMPHMIRVLFIVLND